MQPKAPCSVTASKYSEKLDFAHGEQQRCLDHLYISGSPPHIPSLWPQSMDAWDRSMASYDQGDDETAASGQEAQILAAVDTSSPAPATQPAGALLSLPLPRAKTAFVF